MNYDDTVRYASNFAKKNNYYLVQDTSLKGYTKIPSDEQIKEAIDYLVKDNHEFSRIVVESEKKI